MALLRRFGIPMPDIKPSEVSLPEKPNVVAMVSKMLKTVGFNIITNYCASLSQLLNEAVTKRPPFEHGGKGLCDAVILESYAEHAKKNFEKSRVLVISNDKAVKRSAQRFSDREIVVDFVSEFEIVAKLKSLLSDELSAFIEDKKSRLKKYVLANESNILDFIRKTSLEITDLTINPPSDTIYDGVFGTIESILSVIPIKIIDVVGGAPTYGEEAAKDRYPIRISVEIELEIVVTEPGGFRGGLMGLQPRTRAIVRPDTLDSASPVMMEKKAYDWKPRKINKTIRRVLTVFATLDAEKEKNNVLDDLRIEKVL
jgi:hypothetical protein